MAGVNYQPPLVQLSGNTYTQTFSEATRTHAKSALATNIAVALVTELDTEVNKTNEAVNELKKVINGLIDDLQVSGIVK